MVIAMKDLTYTLNLSRNLRTHPVFFVGLLKPYHDPSPVDRIALAPKGGTLFPITTSPPVQPVVAGCTPHFAVVCRPSRSSRDGLSAHETDLTQSMNLHERVVLVQGSPGVASPHSQTDPVQYARE